jgi:hypothetical protein
VTKQLDNLQAALFAAKDGVVACDAINKLTKLAKNGDEQAKAVLALYVGKGAINHMREHACSCLVETVAEPHAEFAGLFRKGLSDPDLRYWSIKGYLHSAGKGAYKELTRIAGQKTLPLEQRAHAVKCLAQFSKQPFDRHLASDPGYWKETDLRLAEIKEWAKAGYPDGQGYSEPKRHPALDNPKTAFEKIVARLDQKLGKQRGKRQNLADPTDWLALAAPEDIERIKARWDLPSIYLDFLTRFSPIKVAVQSRRFYNGGLLLLGASDLIEGQDGYSFNSIEGRRIKDWPKHRVVIASHGGDPYVLDLAQSDGKDGPIDTAEHGTGVWEFRSVAGSFCEFLETLAK